jgi:hypothetical protein
VERLEKPLSVAAKLSVGGFSILYGLGFLINSLHLSRLGIADFQLLQAQYVLVGLDFIMFLMIPSAVLVPLMYLLKCILKKSHRVPREIFQAVIIVLLAFVLVPFAFENFISEYRHTNVFWRVITFWRFFNPIYLFLHVIFIDLLLADALSSVRTLPSLTLNHHKFPSGWTGVLICILWSIFPFAWIHFPNIKRSVAGGQPQYVRVAFTKDVEQIKIDELLGRDADARSLFILWHENENWIYLSSAHEYSLSMYKTVALDRGLVQGMRFIQFEVTFSSPLWITPHPEVKHFLVER